MSGRGSGGNVIAALCSFLFPGLGQLLMARVPPALVHFLLAGALSVIRLGCIMHIWSAVSAAEFEPGR